MTDKQQYKSHLLEAVQVLILMENQPDYKIAQRCNVAPSTILNIRHGKHVPSVVIAERIFETLGGQSLEEFDLLQ